jgi:hypothetical protein
MEGMCAGVFGHTEAIETHADIACELSHLWGDAGYAFGLDDANGESSESDDVFRTIAHAYPPHDLGRGSNGLVVFSRFKNSYLISIYYGHKTCPGTTYIF